MKKIMEFLKNMLLTIVYPNRILNLFRVKNLDQNSNKILGNDLIVKIIALVLTAAFVIITVYEPATTTNYQRELLNATLDINIDEGYTYMGSLIPTVDIILSGDRTQIELLLASGGVKATLDLRDRAVGTHNNVVLEVEAVNGQSISEQITVTANPGFVSGIEIDRLGTRELEIMPLANEFPEIGIRYGYLITAEPAYVTVSGPQRFLDEIEVVRATYDPSNMAIEAGTSSFEGFLVAHDRTAHPVTGIEIDPGVVEIRVDIFENVRTIGIAVNDSLLSVPAGYEVISVTANVDEIQVWGNFTDMDSVIELPRINFTSLENGRTTLPILLPEGVDSVTTEVEITVVYEEPPPPEPDDDET